MNYRVATLTDFSICLELTKKNLKATPYESLFPDEDLRKQVEVFLEADNRDKLVLLISDEDKDIGIASFETLPMYSSVKIGRLTTVYIEPEYRKQGLIQQIRDAFEHWAKQVGCSYCNINMTKSKADLKKYGYKKIEVMYLKDIR